MLAELHILTFGYRYSRIHQGHSKTKEDVLQSIRWDVKARVMANGVNSMTILNRVLYCKWGLQVFVLKIAILTILDFVPFFFFETKHRQNVGEGGA